MHSDGVVFQNLALDPEENHMRIAAQHMVRAMTAAMCMISCREALLHMMQGYLKSTLESQLRNATPEQSNLIDQVSFADYPGAVSCLL